LEETFTTFQAWLLEGLNGEVWFWTQLRLLAWKGYSILGRNFNWWGGENAGILVEGKFRQLD